MDKPLNQLQKFAKRRLAVLGKGPVEIAVAHGYERNFVNELVKGRKASVQGSNIAKLADVLDVAPPVIIRAMAGEEIDPKLPRQSGVRLPAPAGVEAVAATVIVPQPNEMPKDLPVYGTAAASLVGEFEGFSLEGEVIDYVRRPPSLSGARDAYAIYVVGHSMEPMHMEHDLRFVHPFRPVRANDTVIVQTRNHEHAPMQAFIKLFVRNTPRGVLVRQLNPKAELEFLTATVVAVHRVLTMAELFGV